VEGAKEVGKIRWEKRNLEGGNNRVGGGGNGWWERNLNITVDRSGARERGII
jgi:hypothetical protein